MVDVLICKCECVQKMNRASEIIIDNGGVAIEIDLFAPW
jgi:hypothetical protein